MVTSSFKYAFLLFFSLLTVNTAFSQALFERGFGTPEDDEAFAMCKSSDGGYVVAGYTRFYSPSLIRKPYIVKFNHDGQYVWSVYIPTTLNYTATGIDEDGSGNLFVCATPSGTSGTDSILLCKLSSTGSITWIQSYGGNEDRTANELLVTSGGNILVAGSEYQSSPSKTNGFILNVDGNGVLIGEKLYSSFGNNSFTDIVNTSDGNFVFCSTSRNGNDHYAYLVKTNGNGDSLWTRNIFILNHSSSTALLVNAVTETGVNDIVIGGGRRDLGSYNKAFFMQLNEDATTIINTAGSGISSSLADEITDLVSSEYLTDEVYGSNAYQNFGSHFSLLIYNNQTYSVSPNFQFLNLAAFSFSFHQAIRGPARAIVNDTDYPLNLDNTVMAGSTKLSGYGKQDFAIVKTDESFATMNWPAPLISLHGPSTICPGDSTLITLDANQRDFHRWANLLGSAVSFDLGVVSDSLWVYQQGLYACIAFDADSNIYVSNILNIAAPDTTVTISNAGPLSFCAAGGASVVLSATTQITSPSYQWFLNGNAIAGATASTYSANQTGNYYCLVTSGCGVSTSNTKSVNANAGPNASVVNFSTGILTSCTGSFGFNPQPNEQYRWYDSQGNLLTYTTPTITPPTPGWYSGVAFNACGIDSLDFLAIEFLYPAPAHFNGSPTILSCNGFPIDLEVMSSALGGGPTNITWELNGVAIPGANSSIYQATQPGTYGVTFEDGLCPGVQNYQYCIIQNPVSIPALTINASDTINCFGDTATVQAPLVAGTDYTWMINGISNNTSDSLNLKVPYTWGNVTLTLQINNGCSTVSSNTITIIRDLLDVQMSLAAGCASSCAATLDPQILNGTPPHQFLWSTGATAQQLTGVCNNSTYTITVTNANGCTDTKWTQVNQTPLTTDTITVAPVCGYCNGTAQLSVITAALPVTFLWNNGSTGITLGNLCEGDTWSVTITDANNCTDNYNNQFTTSCDSVWPGDADDNGTVENLDLFPVGLHFGTNGPVRNNASLLWVGQPAPLWGMFQANGNDLKYTDTDGNGTINDDDTLAISLNFNQTHSPFAPPQSIDPDITAIFSSDTVYTGQPIQIQLMLGSSSNVFQDLYGVAYTVTYDNPLTQPAGVYLDQDGWLISNSNGLELTQGNSTTAKVFASMIRTTQTDTSGYGPLATFGCLTSLTLPPGSANYATYNFSITDIKIIDHDGTITVLNSLDTTFVVTDIPTGMANETPLLQGIYPNPSSGEVMISMIEKSDVRLTDNTGRLVQTYLLEKGLNRINMSALANGVYYFSTFNASKPVKVLLSR